MEKKHILTLFALVLSVIGLWAAFYWGMEERNILHIDRANRGQFGDQFGALNTLFAGIGSALLLFTIFAQWSQIRAQQNDLERQLRIAEQNSAELRGQRTELSRAAAANEHQVFVGIAQMKIANLQVFIEVAKLRSVQWAPGSQQHSIYITQMEDTAKKMADIVDELSKRTGAA